MSSVKDALNNAVKEAMKNKNVQRRDALRLLTSAVKQVEVDTRRELNDEEIVDILQKEVKKRRETIEELTRVGRDTSAEQYEVGLLEEFLPCQLSRDKVEVLVREAIAASGASSAKEMGKVMGLLTPQTKGRADGKLVSTIVREMLSTS